MTQHEARLRYIAVANTPPMIVGEDHRSRQGWVVRTRRRLAGEADALASVARAISDRARSAVIQHFGAHYSQERLAEAFPHVEVVVMDEHHACLRIAMA